MANILNALQQDLDAAQTEEEQRRTREERTRLRNAYREARTRRSYTVWPTQNYEAGVVGYTEDGQHKFESLTWQRASALAEKKRKGLISDIQARQFDLGKMYASIIRALDTAFDTNGRHGREAKEMFATEALSAIYLLDLTGNATILARIEKGIKEYGNYEVAKIFGGLFPYFGMVDEYHSDLFPKPEWIGSLRNPGRYINNAAPREELLSVLEAKLRPKQLSPEEEFEKGRQKVLAYKQFTWPDGGVNTAKGTYHVQRGEGERTESARLGYSRVYEIADLVQKGEVHDFEIVSEEDKGKLFGAVEKTIDRLLAPDNDTRNRDANKYQVGRAIAGLYLLGRLDEPQTVETMRKVLQSKPELVGTVRQELQKYAGAA